MKNRKILFIMIITLLFTGCSAPKENELLNEGKLALEKHEYAKAEDLLSQVLTADSTNENARSMYIQAVKMKDAAEYEENKNYDKAIECLEAIEKLKSGSSEIKSEASKKKKELIKLNEEYKKAQEERKENAKDISGQGKYKLEQDAIKENQKQEAQQEAEQEKEEEKEENNQENSGQENNNQENSNQSGNTQGNGGQNNNENNTGTTTQTPGTQPSQPNQSDQVQQETQQ